MPSPISMVSKNLDRQCSSPKIWCFEAKLWVQPKKQPSLDGRERKKERGRQSISEVKSSHCETETQCITFSVSFTSEGRKPAWLIGWMWLALTLLMIAEMKLSPLESNYKILHKSKEGALCSHYIIGRKQSRIS